MNTAPKALLKLESRSWHEQIARVIEAEGTPRFPVILVEALRQIVSFDYSVFFAYKGRERPICVYDTFTPEQRIVFVTDYQEGPYLLDPFYQSCEEGVDPGLYRLRDIAPDRFYHSEYFRSYYRRTGLAEEIAFLVALPHGMMLTISLMRAGTSTAFNERDMNKLRRIEPVIQISAAKHWRSLGHVNENGIKRKNAAPPIDLQVASAFDNFGDGVLTPRERDVVRMVLRGHSSDSIGRHLNITTGTVKIHRKNSYAKLGISSQSELFSHFISHLSGIVTMVEASNR